MSTTKRVCTVGRYGAKMAGVGTLSIPIWIGKIYEARPRKSDGVETWRLVGYFGRNASGWAPSGKLTEELKQSAEHPWKNVLHGQKVES